MSTISALCSISHVYFHAQTAVYMYLMNHGYFDSGKTQRPPIWAPFRYKNGAGSGISLVYLWCSHINYHKNGRLSLVTLMTGLEGRILKARAPIFKAVWKGQPRGPRPLYVKEQQNKRLISRVPRPLVGAPKAIGLQCLWLLWGLTCDIFTFCYIYNILVFCFLSH